MSIRHLASSSRLTLLHPLPLPALPATHLPFRPFTTTPSISYAATSTSSTSTSTTSSPPFASTAGFSAPLSQAYSGSVDQKGKGKELQPHAAPSAATPLTTGVATGTEQGAKKEESSKKRELKSKKNAISMTPAALDRLRALSTSPTSPKLLRITVKSRGCAGMAYHLDYVPPPGGRFDEVVEQDGVRVLIDSKALFSIIGSRMDWRDNRLSAGFVFDNPNVVDTCGCGESFNIR